MMREKINKAKEVRNLKGIIQEDVSSEKHINRLL